MRQLLVVLLSAALAVPLTVANAQAAHAPQQATAQAEVAAARSKWKKCRKVGGGETLVNRIRVRRFKWLDGCRSARKAARGHLRRKFLKTPAPRPRHVFLRSNYWNCRGTRGKTVWRSGKPFYHQRWKCTQFHEPGVVIKYTRLNRIWDGPY